MFIDKSGKQVAGYCTTRDPITDRLTAWIIYDDGSERQLPHLMRHSPTGFEQGYSGSGPSDLARSIIGHRLGANDPDIYYYQKFRDRFIATSKPRDDLRILVREIDVFLTEVGIIHS